MEPEDFKEFQRFAQNWRDSWAFVGTVLGGSDQFWTESIEQSSKKRVEAPMSEATEQREPKVKKSTKEIVCNVQTTTKTTKGSSSFLGWFFSGWNWRGKGNGRTLSLFVFLHAPEIWQFTFKPFSFIERFFNSFHIRFGHFVIAFRTRITPPSQNSHGNCRYFSKLSRATSNQFVHFCHFLFPLSHNFLRFFKRYNRSICVF